MNAKSKISLLFVFFLTLQIETKAQYDISDIIQIVDLGSQVKELNPNNVKNVLVSWAVGGRYDYYWEMADGTIAVNRGVRGYRSNSYVFSSIFDQTSGDCDTEVWQNGKRYRNLCLGNAGGEGCAFVENHGGIVAFYRKVSE